MYDFIDLARGRLITGLILLSFVSLAVAQQPADTKPVDLRSFEESFGSFPDRGAAEPLSIYQDPAFQSGFSALRAQHRIATVGTLTSTAELLESGDCQDSTCADERARSEPQLNLPAPRILRHQISRSHDGRTILNLFWSLQDSQIETEEGQEAHRPDAYEISVYSGNRYSIYRVETTEPYGPTRIGRRVDSSKRGYTDEAERSYYSPPRRAQRNARIVLDQFDAGTIQIVARFDQLPNVSSNAKSEAVERISGAQTSRVSSYSASAEIHIAPDSNQGGTAQERKNSNLFAKSALSQCISANMNAADLKKRDELVALDCTSFGISSLQGIELVPNVQILILDQNPVSDIGPLEALTNLETLSLVGTQVPDFGPLSSLVYLKSVNVSGITGLTPQQTLNLGPLANLPALEEIIAIGLQLDPLPAFGGPLNEVILAGSSINDVSGLHGLTSLERVVLSDTQVGDVNSLIQTAELPGSMLKEVDLTGLSWIYCPQISALSAAIDPGASDYLGVIQPENCEDSLPAPHSLTAGSNVVYGDGFSLTWQLESSVSAPAFAKLERMRPGTYAETSTVSSLNPNTPYLNNEKLDIGLHYFNVQLCVPTGSTESCGGVSETFPIHILGAPTLSISLALANITDDNLRACLTDQTAAALEVGEITSVTCRNWGIGSDDPATALQGLDQFSALTYLDLALNQIGSLQVLRNLPNLRTVDLSFKAISGSRKALIARSA
ncbi:leucine-rich repeat domain-containing protein [Wenzhouxiangella sp. XN79A]|uniref:leucine-rich repeat domain-containing protein n=1 Tax=Wenzhouxiangella sp. XN79A TaxID=2724193 RepID=UPI00144A6C6B|nr:leucine-rich repeat domain-containing protein [Wenzhouxiangella sp. XN79A]NKI35702.1 leucine-rich repeat domain-containing protein [Wenzhouxiangella sp. XN79A]